MWDGVMLLLGAVVFVLRFAFGLLFTANVEQNLIMDDVPNKASCPYDDTDPERRTAICRREEFNGTWGREVSSYEGSIDDVEEHSGQWYD